jgi:pimeloyl-ACP methyl ester carboxylesterase
MPYHKTDDGVRLYYSLRGHGAPTCVFVHGWCSRSSDWDAQLRYFGRRSRVLAIDRRGHGRSDRPDGGYSAKRHAEDLMGILRRERVRRAVVVAHAGGAPTALELAAHEPERVRAMVLIDTRIGPAADLDDPKDPAGSAYRAMVDDLRGRNGTRAFARMYGALFSPHAGSAGRRALANALETPVEIAAAELASLAIDTEGLARTVRAPVLWLTAGAEDEAAIASAFRNVQFGQTVGSGHFPQLEVPDQVNAMIARFVATL